MQGVVTLSRESSANQYLSQVVQLGAVLPDDALQLYEEVLPPHAKVSRGWWSCVRQHHNVAGIVVKALHAFASLEAYKPSSNSIATCMMSFATGQLVAFWINSKTRRLLVSVIGEFIMSQHRCL